MGTLKKTMALLASPVYNVHAMDNYAEIARVHPDGREGQSMLFPLNEFTRKSLTPAELCASINLNWMAAETLFQEGWLSFDPATARELNPAQEAELRFLGRLIVAGCHTSLLKQLLASLRRPYAYRLDQLYYDWEAGEWKLLPSSPHLREKFEEWINDMVDSGQLSALEDVRASVDNSIRELRRYSRW